MLVNFKIGSQQSLDGLISAQAQNPASSQFSAGTFYLTNDSNRLYFAQTDTKLVDLNQYIHIWDGTTPPTKSQLNGNLKSGDIYYLQSSNILAICNDPDEGLWTQLNPDTYLEANAANVTISSTTADRVTISSLVRDSKGNESIGTFTLVGGTNVGLARDGSVITISSTDTNDNYQYALGTTASNSQGLVVLAGTAGGASTSIAIKGDDSFVSVTSTTGNEVLISGINPITGVTNSFNSSGGLVTNLSAVGGDITSAAITPVIVYGATGSTSSAVFANGTANLDIYTKAQVDSMIVAAQAAANAMTYKGTVDSDGAATALSTTANAVGDTYKAEESFTYSYLNPRTSTTSTLNINTGDLLIAKYQDGNVEWDLVPSGDDQVITGSVSGNTYSVNDQNGPLASLTVNGSTSEYGTIAVSSATSGNALTLTVSHGAAGTGSAVTYASATGTRVQETGTAVEIPTITGISTDSAGHVTSVTAVTYSLTDTHANIKNVLISSAAASNVASATITVIDSDDISDSATIRFTSNNLEITSTSSASGVYAINTDLVWGTF